MAECQREDYAAHSELQGKGLDWCKTHVEKWPCSFLERVQMQVRLPSELVKRLDHWSIDRDLNRSEACEMLLAEGLKAMGVDE